MSADEVCEFIFKEFKTDTTYYAHNLSFDFWLFFGGILSKGLRYKWFYVNYLLYQVVIFHEKGKYIFRCSYALLPFKLSSFYPGLCDSPKMFFPYHCLESWNPDILCHNYPGIDMQYKDLTIKKYLSIYAINDCIMLKKSLTNFFKNLKLAGIPYNKTSLTCGSIALNFYTKEFNEINLKLRSDIKPVIRNAYYGGRCEVFGNVENNESILHFDFKGMYQQCMLEDIPYGDFKYKTSDFNINEPGFYFIEIEYFCDIPILPLKKDKLYFCSGCIRGWYWYEEILLALETKNVKSFKIFHALISQSNGPVLFKFISQISQLRDRGMIWKDLGKLIINSFYGRLGLGDEFTLFEMSMDNKTCKGEYGSFEKYFLKKKIINKTPLANIAVAACITSKARIKLYHAIKDVEVNGGRVLYCDTDSVFAAFKPENVKKDKLLGKYVIFDTSKPDTELVDAVFISPKTYGVILKNGLEVIKIKGINIPNINFNALKSAFYNGDNCIIAGAYSLKKKDLHISQTIQNKEISLNRYNKRNWLPDLKKTTPLCISTPN